MALSIRIEGLEGAQAVVLQTSKLPTAVVDGMAALAFATMREGAGRHSPRPQGTGNLFASLHRQGVVSLSQVVGHDLGKAPHAEWVILGSRPHAIVPRNAKMLSWVGPNGRVFARRVWHPGYIGDNYRDAAVDAVLGKLGAIVDATFGGP